MARPATTATALKALLDTFRREKLPVTGVRGVPIALQSFDVHREILRHASLHNSASLQSGSHVLHVHDLAPSSRSYARLVPVRGQCRSLEATCPLCKVVYAL